MARIAASSASDRESNSRQFKFGSITINVHTNPNDGTHTLTATVAGKLYKIRRGRKADVRSEAMRFASKVAEGMPEQAENISQKKLDYYFALEKRMDGKPLDVAVDYYLAHQDERLVKQSVPDLAKLFLQDVKPTISKRYCISVSSHSCQIFGRGFARIEKKKG